MPRWFNTAGPCDPRFHYMVPPEPRLPEARRIIERMGTFVVHAPRQTGKTTTLRSLAHTLTAEGRTCALHFSCETAEVAGDDFGHAERLVLAAIRRNAVNELPSELQPPPWPEAGDGERLSVGLGAWARACPRPLALFFDEIDALRGQSLMTVLRQLRDGFPSRPDAFPASVALCGLRDVRDYKAASGGDPNRLGTSSPFNIKVESLRIGRFTREQVVGLFAQHTDDTGQPFQPAALDRVWEVTQGQPWLVNALAREVVDELGIPLSDPVTAGHAELAKERLILARQTHLDSLVARLLEPRVRRIVAPLLAGDAPAGDTYDDDVQYVRDLGLVAPDNPLRVANPIYREVVARVLSSSAQDSVTAEPRSFVLPDGRLDERRVLEEFAAWWREHGEALAQGVPYHEVAPQLVLMAWLQRIVNGGGAIDREYGVGRGRIDLLLRWPHADPGGRRCVQRMALELKMWRDGQPDPLAKGLEQLDGYLARLGMETGVLVLFDRRAEAAPIAERTRFDQAVTPSGKAVTLLRA